LTAWFEDMIGKVDPLDCQTFDDLLRFAGCSPPRYERVLDVMEAAGVVDLATRLGNEVLRRSRNGELATDEAQDLISELLESIQNPLASQGRLKALATRIWRFE
jgi:hypothetical protein